MPTGERVVPTPDCRSDRCAHLTQHICSTKVHFKALRKFLNPVHRFLEGKGICVLLLLLFYLIKKLMYVGHSLELVFEVSWEPPEEVCLCALPIIFSRSTTVAVR